MPKFSFTVDNKDVIDRLTSAVKAGGNLKQPLELAGVYMMRETNRRFRSATSPSGIKWKPLADSTVKRRRKKSAFPLRDTDRLMQSVVNKGASGNIYNLTNAYVEFGTNLVYANVHQFGAEIIHRARGSWLKLRKTKSGSYRFAKKSHKKAITKRFEVKEYKTNIPARPYLGFNRDNAERINKIFKSWADKVLRGDKK